MKILLLSTVRCGSYALCKSLVNGLDLNFIEPYANRYHNHSKKSDNVYTLKMFLNDVNISKNILVKLHNWHIPEDNTINNNNINENWNIFLNKISHKFDLIIILGRYNLMDMALSHMNAEKLIEVDPNYCWHREYTPIIKRASDEYIRNSIIEMYNIMQIGLKQHIAVDFYEDIFTDDTTKIIQKLKKWKIYDKLNKSQLESIFFQLNPINKYTNPSISITPINKNRIIDSKKYVNKTNKLI